MGNHPHRWPSSTPRLRQVSNPKQPKHRLQPRPVQYRSGCLALPKQRDGRIGFRTDTSTPLETPSVCPCPCESPFILPPRCLGSARHPRPALQPEFAAPLNSPLLCAQGIYMPPPAGSCSPHPHSTMRCTPRDTLRHQAVVPDPYVAVLCLSMHATALAVHALSDLNQRCQTTRTPGLHPCRRPCHSCSSCSPCSCHPISCPTTLPHPSCQRREEEPGRQGACGPHPPSFAHARMHAAPRARPINKSTCQASLRYATCETLRARFVVIGHC